MATKTSKSTNKSEFILQCGSCSKTIDSKLYLQCSLCRKYFDLECCRYSEEEFTKLKKVQKTTWNCVTCCGGRKKGGNNSNTPACSERLEKTYGDCDNVNIATRKRNPASPPSNGKNDKDFRRDSTPCSDAGTASASNNFITEDKLRTILRQEMTMFANQLNEINIQVASFQNSLDFFNSQYEEMKQMLEEKNRVIKKLEADNLNLNSAVTDLSKRVGIMEQINRECNIEINGIPEHRSENLSNTFLRLAKVVEAPLTQQDIKLVTRVAKMNKDSERPRAVIAKLPSVRQRDELLAAVSKYNKNKKPQEKLNSSLLDIAGTAVPVFVSEHLTATNKSLHAATRKKAKENSFRFVWVRDGRIYVRKDEHSAALRIRNTESLKLIA